MRIKPAIGLVVGPVNETHWGQVLTTPNAYAVVEIEDSMRHAQETGVGTLSTLGALLAKQPVSLQDIEDVADRVMHAPVRTLIILVPVGNIVYLVVRGKGSVYIKRGTELASLMHEDGAVSGEVKQGDTILLASNGFSSVLTREELTGLFDHLPPGEIAEKLTLLLHEKSGGEGSAAFVFGVDMMEESVAVVHEDVPVQELSETVHTYGGTSPDGDSAGRMPRLVHAVHNFRKFISKDSLHQLFKKFRENPRAMTALIALFFLILFSVSVILGIRKQTAVKKNLKVEAAMQDAQHALDEGVALLELNSAKGRERLQEGKTILEPLLDTVSSRTMEGRALGQLYQKITDNLTIAMHVVEIQPRLFYDMTLLKKDAVASAIARDGTTLVISDRATNTVYQMDILTKKAQILGGGDSMKGISYVSTHGERSYVLTDAGVVEIGIDEKKPKVLIKKDEEWGNVTSLVTFGGNVYLLDTQKSKIWKYVATETGFSERREYLNPDIFPDLSRASSMAIDGNVWMGTYEGGILRFTQGKENTYQTKGVDPAFGKKLFIYASDDAKNVYTLDPGNERIVVLDKDGMYLAQYRYSGIAEPQGIVVFEAEKLALLLSGGKIYAIDIK